MKFNSFWSCPGEFGQKRLLETPLILNIVGIQGGDTQSKRLIKLNLIHSDPDKVNLDKKNDLQLETPLILNIVGLQGGDTQSNPLINLNLIYSDPVKMNLDKKWLETPLIF